MKVAVITGAARGIGRCLVVAFARKGYVVHALDCDAAALDDLGRALEAKRLYQRASASPEGAPSTPRKPGRVVEVHHHLADVASATEVEAVLERVRATSGRVDVLVCNAGVSSTCPIDESPLEAWGRTLAVNLTGPYLCTRAALPLLGRGSAVILIASTRALMSEPHTEPYSASKGGVLALGHSLAVSLGERGVRVNVVSPGWIDVTGWQVTGQRGARLTAADHAQHPAGRVGRPEDVAEACLFLADPKRAGFVTGANLVVDGGMTVRMIYAE